MSLNEKLAQTLAAMERMERLMEALNNDLEAVKQENHYLKAMVETNNDPTHPDHPLYKSPPNDPSPPPINYPPPSPGKPEIKYREPKIAAPIPFDRKRENTKSFINACQLYISARPSEIGRASCRERVCLAV